MSKRKSMMLIGAVLLIFPIGMSSVAQYIHTDHVVATTEETPIETEEEEKQTPYYYFLTSKLNAQMNETVTVQIESDYPTNEVTISLPKEAKVEGDAVKGSEEGQWIIQRITKENPFELPLSFSQSGDYSLSIVSEEKSADMSVFIEEEETIDAVTEDNSVPYEEVTTENETQLDSLMESSEEVSDVSAGGEIDTNITVTKDNFLEHFDLHGTASYDATNGILRLTNASNNQAGNATLKEKLSINNGFILKGQANIGSNSNGADGIAFGFHDSENAAIGNTGNGMGLAGLKDAFGFKVDSNFNTTAGQGAARDPAALGGAPFAGYIYTESNGMLTTYMGNDAIARRTGSMDGQFKDITIIYNPQENENFLNVSYDGLEWSKNLSSWQNPLNTALSFIISGSTGARNNVHEFSFDSMDYVIGTGEVEVNYVDIETGNKILDSEIIEGALRTRISINSKIEESDAPYLSGYDFVNIDAPENFDFTDDSIEVSSNREVINVNFRRADSQIDLTYLNEQGDEIDTSDTVFGRVGEAFEIVPKEIENYQFFYVDEEKSLTGTHAREREELRLVYRSLSVPPLDPLDPNIEINPENKPEIPEEQGLLSIDFVSQFNFGKQTISVQDQMYHALPQRLLNEDGTVNETEERPNYVQVSDRRPENDRDGWQLSVTQTNEFTNDSGQELNGARLHLNNQELTTIQGGNPPDLQVNNQLLTLTPGVKRTLIQAQENEGSGTWIYRFGNRETSGSSVALEVPKGTNPEATTYTTTLNWELSSVPIN